ncbi:MULTISPECIES: heme ABC transporter permease [Marinimicrobium]|jgi:heme exporter protein C|uniref:Heme exporter protein C n=2 Tax=Marinimicrobium TaxID=359337 RepID=A0A3N1NXT8_9GAMM|nr:MULTISPECIES: heme ABC transporter permease [Marinimicrobium]MAN52246.1 heme ABC transporter permease [Marinimicrobium sp.]ROQ20118.1 heme exporter protein C [Marinimicrobium koreense]
MASWQWFHRLGSPRWFYDKTGAWLPWLTAIALVLLVLGTVWGLAFSPEDFKQGNSYRIIYIHVPAAFLALAGYYVMALCGAVGLIWRMKLAFMVMKSAAPIGAALTFVSLVTGAIWGKPTWGTWWAWDARITSMLILFFLYLGIMALQSAFMSREAADKASAVLALVGTVNIPIIYKSVDWWYTLHQPATLKLTSAPTIHASMLYPLLTMILAFYVFYAVVLLRYTRYEILRRESRTGWVRELIAQEERH